MRIRDYLGISERRQRQATRAMQVALAGILALGFYEGEGGTVVNSAVALAVTFLPALLERDYDLSLDAGLSLWITTAVFLHSVGALGPYRTVWWWDHVTHTLSASIVGGVGYSTARAFDEHSDEVYIPSRFMFVFILVFVIAFGVIWEVLEFGVGRASATFGAGRVLTQYGLDDTMLDLVFDAVGGVVVATWGTAYLTDVSSRISELLDTNR
ncbi:MAG: hypothetical protein SV760_04230 [Halobacteria archaeon]|nr:hypothetical protein [Halobacteria archaeon]